MTESMRPSEERPAGADRADHIGELAFGDISEVILRHGIAEGTDYFAVPLLVWTGLTRELLLKWWAEEELIARLQQLAEIKRDECEG